jgi:hypothetical protein
MFGGMWVVGQKNFFRIKKYYMHDSLEKVTVTSTSSKNNPPKGLLAILFSGLLPISALSVSCIHGDNNLLHGVWQLTHGQKV